MATYTIPQGDDKIIEHVFRDGNGAFDLTGSSVYWRLFAGPDDADADALYLHSWEAGVEDGLTLTDPETLAVADPGDGVLYNPITDTITTALAAGKLYWYELKLVDINGLVTTLDAGTLTITSSPGTAAGSAFQGVSLADLRRRIAQRFGDYEKLVATSSGSTTTFTDVLNLNTATEDMKGRWIVLEDGSSHRITAFDDSAGTITFTPAADAVALTASGKSAQVFNKRSKGFRPSEYDDAVNAAIADAYPLGLIEVTDESGSAFDRDTPEYTVDASLLEVHTVEWEDDDGFWSVIPPATKTNQYGWVADGASGQIRILGAPANRADGFTIRTVGYGRQDILTSDSDSCLLNAEYIVERAVAHLAMANLDKDRNFFGVIAQQAIPKSDRLRTRVRTFKKPGTQRVRSV